MSVASCELRIFVASKFVQKVASRLTEKGTTRSLEFNPQLPSLLQYCFYYFKPQASSLVFEGNECLLNQDDCPELVLGSATGSFGSWFGCSTNPGDPLSDRERANVSQSVLLRKAYPYHISTKLEFEIDPWWRTR